MEDFKGKIHNENPFSLEFDVEKLNSLIEEMALDEEDMNAIEFLFFCHNIYRECYREFIKIFGKLKLKKVEAIRFIYLVVNHYYIELTKTYYQQVESKKDKNNILNLESAVFEKINFENGLNISLSQGLERGGDVIAILLEFLNSFGSELVGEKSLNDYSDSLLTEYSNKLWYYATQYYSFNSFYEIIKYENGSVIIEDEGRVIKIKKNKKSLKLSTLEVIGEVRNLNIYNEYSFGFKSVFKEKVRKKGITSVQISEGIVLPNIGFKNEKESHVRDVVLSLKIGNIFSEDDCDGLRLIDLIQIFSSVSELVNKTFEGRITKNQSLKDIPYAIDKNILIEKISYITNIDDKKVNTVIDSIIDTNESPYFWRKPLYEYDNKIYLSFSLLSAPNYQLLLESYYQSLEINLQSRLLKFKNYILSELIELKYCTIVDNKEEFVDKIILELRDYYLMINISFESKFPIEAKENLDYLDKISLEIDNIDQNIEKLNNNSIKKYIPIVLTNYNKYSGLVLNGIPILDIVLLKNYLKTGAFQKGQVVGGKKKLKSKVFNGFTYYDDEDDFNNNLLEFIHYPVPIYKVKNKIYWIETPILPSDANVQIYIDNYNYVDDQGNIEYELAILSGTLKNQYLANLEGKLNDLSNKTILFRLTNIFHYIAFSKYELVSYRHQLINLFTEVNINGYIHLLNYFKISLRYLGNIKLKKDNKFKSIEYNSTEVFKSLEKIFEKNEKISITALEVEYTYTKEEEKKIISLAIDIISTITIKKYETEEIENYLVMLAIIRYFKTKYNLSDYFYLGVSNIISVLNHNFLYQQARNLAEEVFAIAINERNEYKGWGILFMCSDQQRNKFNSIIYSCFYLNSLSIVDKLPYTEAIDVFYNILKFARNFELIEILDDVFTFMKGLKLEEYDYQKIHLTYYLSIVNRKQKDRRKIIDDSIMFFNDYKERIFKYEEKGAIPWLNYFYNIKRLNDEGFESINVDEIIEKIEAVLDEEIILEIRSRHFYNENTKGTFIKNLKRVFVTYYVSDFVSEITNLELDTHIIIENAIKENDFESILLTGLVNNDIRLIYKENNEVEGMVSFNISDSNNQMFDHYLNYIIDNIKIKPKQLFIYLFSNQNKVYYLKINDRKEMSIEEVVGWKSDSNFLKNKDKFYYNSADFFGIEEQEEHYKKLLGELQYTSLGINEEYEELLVATNLELSKMPLNLIKNNDDFIGSNKPITNVLLIEWFRENSEDLIIEDLSLNCWIPIEDGDPTLNLGYDKLKPVLDEFKIETFTKSIPEQPLHKDINIFFAHGELDNIGFKAVSLNDEKFIINKEKLFGSGKIAILFICHSGSINQDMFSNKVQSLIYDLIQNGYKSVIAPFWALEATIPAFWLKYFLDNFNEGNTISESVYLANNGLADYHQEISNSFFVPEGRLAMHLYGNPNIKLKESSIIE